MNHEELTELLQSLPREKASAGFTTRVKAHVDESPRKPRWTFALGTALAAILLIATVGTIEFAEQRREEQRIQQLTAEKEQIAKELEELRSIAADADRVVVGSSGSYDLVLDVGNQKKVSSTNLPVVIVSDDGAL